MAASSRRGGRTVAADARVRAGRLAKARQFLTAADDVRVLAGDERVADVADVADAAVTLYVHAGIAAADAICAGALGAHAQGENHRQAIQLLATVDGRAADSLEVLLAMKTRAGYGHDPVTLDSLKKAERAAHQLVTRAGQ